MFFSANSAVEQEVIVAAMVIALFIYTLLMHTNARSIEAQCDFALGHRLQK